MSDTTNIRVTNRTRWALKVASARIDITIIELLARVETGDNEALRIWRDAVKEVEGG